MLPDNNETETDNKSHEPDELSNAEIVRQDKRLESYIGDDVQLSEPLTKRERQILSLLAAGKTNKEIARDIYRSTRTVEFHRNSLMRKFGARTVAQLIRKAITAGYI